jgi:hypothetical protein
MTTQELDSLITPGAFSEATMQKVHGLIGSASELTPEMVEQIMECLANEMDEELKDVELDPETEKEIEDEANAQIAEVDALAEENYQSTQQNLNELIDMSKKVDVLERLHS